MGRVYPFGLVGQHAAITWLLAVSGVHAGSKDDYYWPSRLRTPSSASSSPFRLENNFDFGPHWAWANIDDEQIRHSPLLDNFNFVYITTTTRVRKFSPDGTIMWTHKFEDGYGTTMSPALYKGEIFVESRTGNFTGTGTHMMKIVSLDMVSGHHTLGCSARFPAMTHGDATSMQIFNDTIFFPTRNPLLGTPEGNNQLNAMNIKGKLLWTFDLDDVVFNMAATTSGDNDVLVGSQCGGAWRLTLDGNLIWRGGRAPTGYYCGNGGGVAGPNGVFYIEFNQDQGSFGVVSALQISDGQKLWEKTFPDLGGWQYPAVGYVGSGPQRTLAVVAALGATTGPVRLPSTMDLLAPLLLALPLRAPSCLGDAGRMWNALRLFFPLVSIILGMELTDLTWPSDKPSMGIYQGSRIWWDLKFWLYQNSNLVRQLFDVPVLPNSIVVLNAATGEVIWTYDKVDSGPYRFLASLDDEYSFTRRSHHHIDNETTCLPDVQGVPIIAGDGTVYASSGHNGDLVALNDTDGNGIIDETYEANEARRYSMLTGFVNSPSLGPGMLVAAPCFGPVFGFKELG